MPKAEDENQARLERARAIGLFRYMLIREAADPGLSSRQRGTLVRKIAAQEHTGPSGRRVRLTRWTLARTATQVRRVLKAQLGWAPDERTLQRMFTRTGLTSLTAAGPAPVFGRFEAARPNEIWTGDALHGPKIGGRKTYLFCFLDDHSRAVMAARWGFAEDTIRLAAALRPALAARGVPEHIYVDNGSAFVDAWLLRACAKLDIKIIHSAPGRPQGRGKIERFFRTVRGQFLAADGPPPGSPAWRS